MWDLFLGGGGVGGGECVWCIVLTVCVVSLDYVCRWHIQVSVYCARQIPLHLR